MSRNEYETLLRKPNHGAENNAVRIKSESRLEIMTNPNRLEGDGPVVTDPEPGFRLRGYRQMRGYATASDFARMCGVKVSTYIGHENGSRAISPEAAAFYAQHLRVPVDAILYGDGLSHFAHTFIFGEIRGEDGVDPVSAKEIAAANVPKTKDLTGLVCRVVKGNELDPVYRDGDRVWFRPLNRFRFDARTVHGLECIVETEDERLLVRRVVWQGGGRCTLIGYNRPIMYDVALAAASPIEMVERNLGQPAPRQPAAELFAQ
jgi:DNA-binding XRE family transcriptional regulator